MVGGVVLWWLCLMLWVFKGRGYGGLAFGATVLLAIAHGS